jgi:putative sterol carrier protein
MTDVPEHPRDFFSEYVPKRFERVKAALSGKTSAGSMTFRVSDIGEWSYRLAAGELAVSAGMADDALLQITVANADFKPFFVRGAELQEGAEIRPDAQILAFKVLTVDEERAKLIGTVNGTVAFVVSDGDSQHKLFVTPGKGSPNTATPDCRLECTMSDFMDLLLGKHNPMQLAMAGRIRIIGNAQIPMALAAVFV